MPLDTTIDMVDCWQFLGVTIDKHLNFHENTKAAVRKARKRFYMLVQLKRQGVVTGKLSLFYCTHIRSVLTYGVQAVFSMLTKCQVDSLEAVQKMSTKIILPGISSYHDRLEKLRLPELCVFSRDLYRAQFLKIFHNPKHPLYQHIPSRQSDYRRHSSRTVDRYLTVSRTVKRQNSFFFYYAVNNFFVIILDTFYMPHTMLFIYVSYVSRQVK